MSRDVNTCPKCGALISPNLPRCRQCKEYLHGTQLEGFLLEHLLPAKLAAAPGTGVFFLLIIGYYILMVMFAGVDSAPGFSGYSTQQLGSTWSLGIYEGQYWRFVTSVFGHGDIIHIAFNLYALTIAGPLIEELFDRKKMILICGVSGILSMVASHVFYTRVLGQVYQGSLGASGAVSGLIGACLVGARRRGPDGRQIAQVMLQWTAYMVIWGFAMGGIDNAAHAGGWLVGAGLAALMPLGLTQTVAAQRGLSVLALGLLGLCLLSIGMMLAHLRGYPASLPQDMYPRGIFMFTYAEGSDPDFSSQQSILDDCRDSFTKYLEHKTSDDEQVYACELAVRASPSPIVYEWLAVLHTARGNDGRARRLRHVLQQMQR